MLASLLGGVPGGARAGVAGLAAPAGASGRAAAATLAAATAGAGGGGPAAPLPPAEAVCRKALHVSCYRPSQVERAYGLPPFYFGGFDGRGRTIVIVDPFGSPTIAHDLGVFDRAFGLPAPPSLRVIQPAGRVPPFNPDNPLMVDKAGETTLDVEWSHAIAPGARILLAETPGLTIKNLLNGGNYPTLMKAVNYVAEHNLGDVISQSYSLPERNFPAGAIRRLRYAFVNAARQHVTVLAASNDNGVSGSCLPPSASCANTPTGAFYQRRVVEWPASDPLVTGVGGTKLHLTAAGLRTSPDTAWNDTRALPTGFLTPWASNGGRSAVFSRPRYQDPVRRTVGARRGVPDVSMSAAVTAGVLTYASFPGNTFPFHGWEAGGGTSEATPEFAGIVAIASQYAGRRLGLINPALYLLHARHAPGIIDVTRGNNTVSFLQPDNKIFTLRGHQAKPGYDLVTGVGTIDATRFVPELARMARRRRR